MTRAIHWSKKFSLIASNSISIFIELYAPGSGRSGRITTCTRISSTLSSHFSSIPASTICSGLFPMISYMSSLSMLFLSMTDLWSSATPSAILLMPRSCSFAEPNVKSAATVLWCWGIRVVICCGRAKKLCW